MKVMLEVKVEVMGVVRYGDKSEGGGGGERSIGGSSEGGVVVVVKVMLKKMLELSP